MIPQRGGGFVDGAGGGLGGDRFDVFAVAVHTDPNQPAGRIVQVFVDAYGAGDAVGTQNGDFLHHIRTVFLDQAAGSGLDYAVKDFICLLPGDDVGYFIVHAQQQGHDLPHAAAVEGRDLGGHRRAAEGVGAACHGHRGRCAGRGCHGGDPACGAAGIEPDGLERFAVIIDVVLAQRGLRDSLIVAVDGGGDKGKLRVGCGHKGSLEAAEQHRRGVHLPVGNGETQRGAIGRAAGRVGGQGIVEQHSAVLIVHGLTLLALELAAQADLLRLVQLGSREGAGQLGHLVAHHLEDGSDGFLQSDGVVRAEAAVGVAVHPALLDGNADIGGVCRCAGQIREEGADRALRGGTLPVGREGGQHPGKGTAGDDGVQGSGLGGVHRAQRDGKLDGSVRVACRRCRDHQHRDGQTEREQKGEKSFFHDSLSLLDTWLSLRESCRTAPPTADGEIERAPLRLAPSPGEQSNRTVHGGRCDGEGSSMVRGLIISQCFDRVEPCGASGGQIAEEHADAGRDAESDHDRIERRADRDAGVAHQEGQHSVGRCRDEVAQHDAQRTAESRRGGRLDDELRQNDPLLGTQSFPDADLPGALRDRHQHDVHDADAAHQQGDAGDAGEDDDDHVDHLVHLLQPLAGTVNIVGTVGFEQVIEPLL